MGPEGAGRLLKCGAAGGLLGRCGTAPGARDPQWGRATQRLSRGTEGLPGAGGRHWERWALREGFGVRGRGQQQWGHGGALWGRVRAVADREPEGGFGGSGVSLGVLELPSPQEAGHPSALPVRGHGRGRALRQLHVLRGQAALVRPGGRAAAGGGHLRRPRRGPRPLR